MQKSFIQDFDKKQINNMASVSLNHRFYNNLFKISCSNDGLQNNQAIQKESGNLLEDNGPPSYARQDVL